MSHSQFIIYSNIRGKGIGIECLMPFEIYNLTWCFTRFKFICIHAIHTTRQFIKLYPLRVN